MIISPSPPSIFQVPTSTPSECAVLAAVGHAEGRKWTLERPPLAKVWNENGEYLTRCNWAAFALAVPVAADSTSGGEIFWFRRPVIAPDGRTARETYSVVTQGWPSVIVKLRCDLVRTAGGKWVVKGLHCAHETDPMP